MKTSVKEVSDEMAVGGGKDDREWERFQAN